MSNYSKTTDFEAKDSLPTGDSGKIIRGAEFETEFDAISTAIATKADTAGPTFTGTLTFETISDGTIGVTAFVDEDDMSSDSATLVPTQQSVKAYVDSQVTAQDLDFQADSGGALSIDLDSETMTFTGGTGIDTSGSGNAVTFAIDSTVATLTGTQTLTNKTLTTPTISGNLTTDGTIDGRDVATDGAKLDGIEAGATADQTAAEIRTLVDSASDSNVFTDADHSKLDGIEAGATGDQTNAEIRAAVEAATDSNVFTDADHSKLDGIEALADVTDTANVTAAGALMDSELTSEASVKALNQGVATTDSPAFAGVTVNGTVEFDGLSGTGAVSVTDILDQDDMSSNSATALATQQSIKAYVDTTVAATNELVEDTTPQLGGDLDLNGNDITGTGNINNTGTITTDGLTVDGNTNLTGDFSITDNIPKITLEDSDTSTLASISANSSHLTYTTTSTSRDHTFKQGADTRMVIDSTGIDVTGTVTADSAVIDNITIDGTEIDSSSSLSLDIAGNLTIDVDGSTVTLADGGVNFGQFYQNASGQFNINSPTQDKDIVFLGNDGGSSITALTLDMSSAGYATFKSGAVFNEDSADSDFRVESNGNANMLFVDGGTDRVGLRTNAPSDTLDVRSGGIRLYDNTDGNGGVISFGSSAGYQTIGGGSGSNNMNYRTYANHVFKTTTGPSSTTDGTERMSIGTGVVINETGASADFRVESNTKTHMLFVDGANNFVGVAESSPDALLHINATSNGNFQEALRLTNAGGGSSEGAFIRFEVANTDGHGAIIGARRSGFGGIDLRFDTGEINGAPVTAMTIDHDQNVGIGVGAGFISSLLHVGGNILSESSSTLNTTIRATGNNTRAIGNYQAHDSSGNDVNMSIGVFGDVPRGELSTATNHTLRLYVNNTPSKYLEIATTGQIFTSHGMIVNEDSNDSDFRVESNANSTFFFVDAGSERLHINGATGTSTFNVAGSSSFASTASSGALSASGATLSIQGTGTYNSNYFGTDRATVAIRSNEPSNDGWNPTLNIATIRQSLATNQNATGGIGFTTIDDSNNTGIDDAGRIEIANTNGAVSTSATRMVFYNNVGGSKAQAAQQVMSLDPYETILNEDSLDRDFRIESNNNANAILLDAGNDRLNIDAEIYHDSNDGSQRFYITRSGATDQTGSMFVGDSTFILDSVQDEAGLSYGGFLFRSSNATNSNVQLLNLDQTESRFNEDGADIDFRVESDNDTHALFVEGSSGNVGIGTSSVTNNSVRIVGGSSSGSNVVSIEDSDASVEGGSTILNCSFSADTDFSTANYITFNDSGGSQGSITGTGAGSVAYNTTSDRRAKENIANADDAGAIIDSIQVRKFDWKRTGGHQPYGMIAQELLESVPDAVHQPVNEEDMMGVDYSKLVPMLIKEIQSLRARVAQLESN